jgi:L-ascorbate metabolism protein UlaG (beta-lactamase superfamily)
MLNHLFPRFIAKRDFTPRGTIKEPSARIRWLGTASHHVQIAGKSILIDPFLSRPSMLDVGLLPLRSDIRALTKHIDFHVDAIACGHSHYDHVMDAPELARRTGALLIGSESTCLWGRALGLPDSQLRVIGEAGGEVSLGPVSIEFIASRHGKATLGRVAFPGKLVEVPDLPGRVWNYKMGGAFGVLIKSATTSIYHNGSADLLDAALEGKSADVLLACLAGRKGTERYVPRLVERLQPSVVVPSHHDAFFFPLEEGVRLLPRIDVDGFLGEVRSVAKKVVCLTPDYQDLLLVAQDPRASVLQER